MGQLNVEPLCDVIMAKMLKWLLKPLVQYVHSGKVVVADAFSVW